jgi:5-methylcytosine-specific restriction enzyme A
MAGRSDEARGWRRLYKTAAWKRMRLQAFVRDGYRCAHCGDLVSLNSKHPHGAVGDHVVDHKGNEDLFFDLSNVRTVGKSCHDRHSQREAHGTALRVIGMDGWPIDG